MLRLYALIMGYLFGSIQAEYLYKKLKNKYFPDNKRKDATGIEKNAWKILGIVACIIDFMKVIVVRKIVFETFDDFIPEDEAYLGAAWMYCPYACLGAILGHYYPFYLKFKGDKGIAAYLGVVMALFDTPIWSFYLIALICEKHDTKSFSRTFLRVTIMFDILYIIYSYTVCLDVPFFSLNIMETCIIIIVIGIIAYVNQLVYVRERLEAES